MPLAGCSAMAVGLGTAGASINRFFPLWDQGRIRGHPRVGAVGQLKKGMWALWGRSWVMGWVEGSLGTHTGCVVTPGGRRVALYPSPTAGHPARSHPCRGRAALPRQRGCAAAAGEQWHRDRPPPNPPWCSGSREPPAPCQAAPGLQNPPHGCCTPTPPLYTSSCVYPNPHPPAVPPQETG